MKAKFRTAQAQARGPFLALCLVLSALVLAGNSAYHARPAAWAQPLQVEGVPNLFKVSERLYRSAQPEETSLAGLRKLGIRTIINLRGDHPYAKAAADAGLEYIEIPSDAGQVRPDDVRRFLKIVSDPAHGPYLVHCHHGADRTGLMVAAYRVVLEGWPNDQAVREMKEGGFGFHSVYTNIVSFIEKLDRTAYQPGQASGGQGQTAGSGGVKNH